MAYTLQAWKLTSNQDLTQEVLLSIIQMQAVLVVVEVVFQHKLKFTHIRMNKGLLSAIPFLY